MAPSAIWVRRLEQSRAHDGLRYTDYVSPECRPTLFSAQLAVSWAWLETVGVLGRANPLAPYTRCIHNERTDRDQASHSDSRAVFDGADRLASVGGLVSGHDQCLQENRRE